MKYRFQIKSIRLLFGQDPCITLHIHRHTFYGQGTNLYRIVADKGLLKMKRELKLIVFVCWFKSIL